MYRITVCLFLLLNARVHCLMSLSDIGDVISFTHEVVIDVLKTWHVVSPMITSDERIDLPLLKDTEKRLISKIALVKSRVDRVDKVLQGVATATMLNLQEDIPTQIRTEMKLDALLQLVTMIHTADNAFQEYLNLMTQDNSSQPQLEQHTLQNFASYVVSHNPDSVQGILDKIHYMISPDSKLTSPIFLNKGLYNLVIQALQIRMVLLRDGCSIQLAPQEKCFSHLTTKASPTIGEFTVESRLMRERHIERMLEQVRSIKTALKSADQSYWKCDPIHHVEGETYEQFTRLLQGYIQNEVDLNSEQSCSENCGYYSVTKQYGCFQNQFCSKQRSCNGDIVDCQFIDADMWVCQADPRKSSRRYDWVAYENGRVLGNKGTCYRQNKVDSWWRWLFWHCSYCFCICDDPAFSDRYINLRSVLSNVADNKVVVGIRFVKNNGIMHLQIQEAQMLPFASVNQSSIQWRSVDQYKTSTEGVIEGRDYVTLSYKKRGIDLDDLKAPEGHVVIGVKFRVVGSHVNLEVLAAPFNFTTGQLDQPGMKSIWISNDNTDASPESPRTQVILESPENPLHSLSSSKIDSKHDQYLLFTYSDVDLDAAQTTVPFFDAQIVAPQPATLLSGIGIYHKGNKWFGGFIGVKVFTLDYSVYLQDTFPNLNETEYITKG